MNAQELFERGCQLVEEEDFEPALKIAQKLRKMGFSGAYELEARVFRERGNLRHALEVLDEGVREAPGVWVLWLYRGSTLSDLGRYDEAIEAYERGCCCPGADMRWIRVNQALVHLRAGRPHRAIEICPVQKDLPKEAVDLKARILAELGRHEEAVEFLDQALETPDLDVKTKAELHRLRARSLQQPEEKRAELRRALETFPLPEAVEMIPDVFEPPHDANLYQLRLEGRWTPETGFFRTYAIVAESEEQALELALELEPDHVEPTVCIDSCEVLGPAPARLGPVLWKSGHGFYQR